MKLRNGDRALVERRKVVDYLLNAAHPDNGGKARFFEACGFTADHADELIVALCLVAVNGEVVQEVESSHGEKSVVDGRLESPTGKQSMVRTIWIVDRGQSAPRLVTAYPVEE